MKDLGLLHYFLGLEVWQDKDQLILIQAMYVEVILKMFRMECCKPTSTPMDPYVKLRIDDPSDEVDARLYHKLISILPYFCNTHPNLS